MPLFEYKCKICQKVFEEFVKKYDDEVKCPTCGEVVTKNFSGKVYTSTGKCHAGCTGDCKTCGGCH